MENLLIAPQLNYLKHLKILLSKLFFHLLSLNLLLNQIQIKFSKYSILELFVQESLFCGQRMLFRLSHLREWLRSSQRSFLIRCADRGFHLTRIVTF